MPASFEIRSLQLCSLAAVHVQCSVPYVMVRYDVKIDCV